MPIRLLLDRYLISRDSIVWKDGYKRKLSMSEDGRGKMDITEIKVFPVNEDKLKAYITIVLDNCFVVRDLKIISGNGGLFVAMPSKRRKDGVFKDIAHPLNQGTRTVMEKKILDAYLTEIKRLGKPVTQTADQAEREDS
jgi:stage V sporulation protein G